MSAGSLPLRVVPGAPPLDPQPRAALLSGAGPEAWLGALASWGQPLGALLLWPLPRAEGQGLAGALLPLPRGVCDLPPGALPLALRGERLYLPLDARLLPDTSDEELAQLLGRDAALLSPTLGLVRLPRAAAVAVSDLVAAPGWGPAGWGPPPAVPPPLPPLLRVEPREPPSLDALLAGERRALERPPTPPQRQPGHAAGAGAADAARPDEAPRPEAGQEADGAGGSGTAEAPAEPAGGEGWLRRALRRVEGWLRGDAGTSPPDRPAGQPPPEPEQEPEPAEPEPAPAGRGSREQELDRLLRMLEQDPDRALRHALPLAGAPGSEGAGPAPPATPPRLPERDPRFSLDPPEGVRGAAWVVPADLHLRLARRYRELAERELAFGRPLRAAYIYWQLLGDARAAAQALEQGGHHREAAELWRRRLRQGHEAARCLERGGHLLEAAELWEGEGELERAGDLYQRVGREEDARARWRTAAEVLRAGGDPCGAARLLESKLAAPDEALALLHAGWPGGAQARECLRGELFLLGRLGRHGEASRRLGEVLREGPPRWRELALAEVLLDGARRYPDGQVRAGCRDGVRVVAGAALPRASAREAESLVRVVTALDPEDRLLGRDARRYLAGARRRAAALDVHPPAPMREARRVREVSLGREVLWHTACPSGDGFWAAGRGPHGPVVLRGRWDGPLQQVTWPGLELEGELLLLPPASPTAPALVVTRSGGRLPLRMLPRQDELGPAVKVCTPGWVPEHLRAWHLVHGAGVAWLLHGNAHGLILSAHHPDAAGRLLSSDVVAPDAREAAVAHLLQTPRGPVWLALGARLERREGRRVLARLELDGPIRGLAGAPGRALVAAALEQGVALIRPRGADADELVLGRELRAPQVTFTGDGRLVVAAPHEGRVYDLQGDQPVLRATFPGPGAGVIACFALPSPRQVAFVTSSGWIRIYELP